MSQASLEAFLHGVSLWTNHTPLPPADAGQAGLTSSHHSTRYPSKVPNWEESEGRPLLSFCWGIIMLGCHKVDPLVQSWEAQAFIGLI